MLVIKHLILVLSIVSSAIGIQMFLLFNSGGHLSCCREQGHTGVRLILGHRALGWLSLAASLNPTLLDLPSEGVAHTQLQF